MAVALNSPICDIRHIDNAVKTVAYLGKYLTKANHQFGHCKRYWHSRDYLPEGWDFRKQNRALRRSWAVLRTSLEELAVRLQVLGIQYRMPDEDTVVWKSDESVSWDKLLNTFG